MSKRRVTALVALAGLLDVYFVGGCHTPGHRCCELGSDRSGKAHVCDMQQKDCNSSPGAIAYEPTPPSISAVEPDRAPVQAPPVTSQPELPTIKSTPVDTARDPVVVDKPKTEPSKAEPWDFEEPLTNKPPVEPNPVEIELPPPSNLEPEPVKEPLAADPVPSNDPMPEAAPVTDTLALLKKLGAVVKFNRAHDPFGDKETVDGVVGLDFSSAQITDAELKLLAEMTNVREIDLTGTPVTDAGLKELQGLAGLELLWLNGTKVTDYGLESIAGMANLKSLGLANTSVGDEGIRRVAGLTKLEYLLLAHTQITDTGMEHLHAMSNLKGMSLMGSQVTPQGVKQLRKALPSCQVVYNTKKETSALPLLQRRPFGWFPHLIASNSFKDQSVARKDSSAGHAPAELEVSRELPVTENLHEESATPPALEVQDPNVLDSTAKVCMAEERWEDAVALLGPAVEKAPENVMIRYHLAVALGRSGRIDDALPLFIQTVGEAEAHYNVGVILYEAGDLRASERHLDEALRINPELAVAREQLDDLRRELEAEGRPVKQTAFFRRLMFRP